MAGLTLLKTGADVLRLGMGAVKHTADVLLGHYLAPHAASGIAGLVLWSQTAAGYVAIVHMFAALFIWVAVLSFLARQSNAALSSDRSQPPEEFEGRPPSYGTSDAQLSESWASSAAQMSRGNILDEGPAGVCDIPNETSAWPAHDAAATDSVHSGKGRTKRRKRGG